LNGGFTIADPMRVFDHVTIRAADRSATRRFYDCVLEPLDRRRAGGSGVYDRWGNFFVAQADSALPPTRRLHVAFYAQTRDVVDAFWHAGVGAGYTSDGEPGLRPQYAPDYYGAFLLDPDGNSAEAVTHERVREDSLDHLWVRVADLEATRRFYETIVPVLGLRFTARAPERFHVAGDGASMGLVRGERPTENVHMAFPTPDVETVREFHRVAVAAGYRDNGAPGERAEYHEGYYAAFVLDPDGNNVEAVNHSRS
jgi:catechol 2,3-dioxygenase-like lactoylglutathione lyase family enzyme